MAVRSVRLARLTEDEAIALYGLLLDLIDGREDFAEAMRVDKQPPDWRALLRILDHIEQGRSQTET